MATDLLGIDVVFAQPGSVWLRRLQLPAGSTLEDALQASQAAQALNLSPDGIRAGVFGLERPGSHMLADGDRVEIYRPLRFDPMESRRRRAAHRQTARGEGAASDAGAPRLGAIPKP